METVVSDVRGNYDDAEYDAFLHRVKARFLANVAGKPLPKPPPAAPERR
jgi:hypothetical protein